MKTADIVVRDVAAVLADLNRKKDILIFLEALLTPPESARIGLRWRLVCMLSAGVPQRVIAERLGISLCKITRGSRELKFKPAFRKIVAAYKKIRRKKRKENKSRLSASGRKRIRQRRKNVIKS